MKPLLSLITFLTLVFAVSTQNHPHYHNDENTHQRPRCGRQEEYGNCGSNCQEHCPIRNSISGEIETGLEGPCNKACHRGCFCFLGLLRDLTRGGECVRRSDCRPIALPQQENQNPVVEPSNREEPVRSQCGPNEVYRTCGPRCQEQCPQGCFCAPGRVRDSQQNNACVERNQCRTP